VRRWTPLPEAYGYTKGRNFAQSFRRLILKIGFPPETRRVKKKRPGA
jgi:hypothetical protein